jgi:LemA protein
VKGYAKHESEVFQEVTKARAQVGQVRAASPEDLQAFDKAQTQLSQSLSRLLVVAERYPELKADRNFLELQSQLEGSENRIAVERMRFNEAAREYNTYLRKFPQSLVAGIRNFKERPYFEAESGAKTAPKVQF